MPIYLVAMRTVKLSVLTLDLDSSGGSQKLRASSTGRSFMSEPRNYGSAHTMRPSKSSKHWGVTSLTHTKSTNWFLSGRSIQHAKPRAFLYFRLLRGSCSCLNQHGPNDICPAPQLKPIKIYCESYDKPRHMPRPFRLHGSGSKLIHQKTAGV